MNLLGEKLMERPEEMLDVASKGERKEKKEEKKNEGEDERENEEEGGRAGRKRRMSEKKGWLSKEMKRGGLNIQTYLKIGQAFVMQCPTRGLLGVF